MSPAKKFALLAAPALLAVAGCATPGFRADVARYQAMPAPQGQSFAVVSAKPADRGSLEFAHYADLVSRKLAAEGYRPAGSPAAADFVVELDYGVDQGREVTVRRPGFGASPYGFGSFYRPFYGFGRPYGGFGHPFYGRRSFYGPSRYGFYYGWDDPFWYSPYGFGYDNEREITVYESFLELDIRDRAGRALFEGKAEARSRTDDLPELVPNLVEAMFKDFPGRSGETVKITVPPAPRQRN